MLNKYIDNAGYIDVPAIAMQKKRQAQTVAYPKDMLIDLNRRMALYALGCLVTTGIIVYFGMS